MANALKTLVLLAASLMGHGDHHHPLDHTHQEESIICENFRIAVSA